MILPIILQISDCFNSFAGRNYSIIGDKTVLKFLLSRLKTLDAQIIAAVTNSQKDDKLADILRNENIDVCRGNVDSIVERLLTTARHYGLTDFVRVLGNNPFVDLNLLSALANSHNGHDYSYNNHTAGALWGMECDCISVKCLEKLIESGVNNNTFHYYIRQNENKFKLFRQDRGKKRLGSKLFLETKKDLNLLNELAANVDEINCDNIERYLLSHPAAAHSNQETAVKEVGLDKLYLNVQKFADLMNTPEDEICNSYPVSVELSLTNRCNIACVYCSDRSLRAREHGAEINLDTLDELFRDLAMHGTKGIVIEGGGEPCLHSEFSAAVEVAKKHGLAVGLITNGTIRLSEKTVRSFEWIRVSLDASTPNEYLELKGIDMFEIVLENIAYYTQYCNTVGVGYVVTNKNVSELESLVLRLRIIGASYIQFRPVVDSDDLLAKEIDLTYLTYYESKNFSVIIDGMKENSEPGNFNLSCTCHSITSIITAEGNVYLCGRLNIYDWLEPIGNVNKMHFNEIWNGAKRRSQSEMVSVPEFCSENCPQCRVSKFNKKIHELKHIETKNFI